MLPFYNNVSAVDFTRPLDIQAKVLNGGGAEGQQQSRQGDGGHLEGILDQKQAMLWT